MASVSSGYRVPDEDFLPLLNKESLVAGSIFDATDAPINQTDESYTSNYIWRIKKQGFQWSSRKKSWSLLPVAEKDLGKRELLKRLDALRHVKLEVEEDNEKKKSCIRFLTKKLEEANTSLNMKGGTQKVLVEQGIQLRRSRLRMKELGARIDQVLHDYDKLNDVVKIYRPEMRCQRCKHVRRIEAFAKNPDCILGREARCNICQREKTQRWRAAKKYQQQGGG